MQTGTSSFPRSTGRKLKEQVRCFWESRPCGAQFGGADEVGTKAFFDNVEKHRYALEEHIPEAADFTSARGQHVLEIGCGLGTDGAQFARAGALYTGIDLTRTAVGLTRRRFRTLGLSGHFLVGDAEELDVESDTFDLVYSHGVLHHTPNIERAVREIYRVLRPGGRATVMLYHRNSYNYHINIRLLRRIRAPLLRWETGIWLAHALWGEPVDELRRHAAHLRRDARAYLHEEAFLSRNTDGADCPVTRVYSREEATELFTSFAEVHTRVYGWTPRWPPLIGHLLPSGLRAALGARWGWHLWVFASKPGEPHHPAA